MLMKALALAGVAFSCVSATESHIAPWRHPEVVQIMCDKVAGSAVRIGPSMFASVAHVTHNAGCKINGRPFKETYQKGDFVVLSYDVPDAHWMKVDCDGFKKDRTYTAIGFAHALDTQTEVDLHALGKMDGKFGMLAAVFTIVPGMSGGPVVDADTGKVVGMNNMFNPDSGISLSVQLKDTGVCKA